MRHNGYCIDSEPVIPNLKFIGNFPDFNTVRYFCHMWKIPRLVSKIFLMNPGVVFKGVLLGLTKNNNKEEIHYNISFRISSSIFRSLDWSTIKAETLPEANSKM